MEETYGAKTRHQFERRVIDGATYPEISLETEGDINHTVVSRIQATVKRVLKHLQENPKAAASIDIYKDKGHKAVCLQGNVTIIEKGEEFARIYKKFQKRFQWVRDQPWKENEAPFVKITPKTKTSWGLE